MTLYLAGLPLPKGKLFPRSFAIPVHQFHQWNASLLTDRSLLVVVCKSAQLDSKRFSFAAIPRSVSNHKIAVSRSVVRLSCGSMMQATAPLWSERSAVLLRPTPCNRKKSARTARKHGLLQASCNPCAMSSAICGSGPEEQAINYAVQIAQVFREAIEEEMDDQGGTQSDLSSRFRLLGKLTFFNPSKVFEQARKVYLFTAHVSDVVPVMIGPVRFWSVQ